MQQSLKDYLNSKLCRDVVNMINDDYIVPYYKMQGILNKFLWLDNENKEYFGDDGFGEKNRNFFIKMLPDIPSKLLEHVEFSSYENREVKIKFKVGKIYLKIFLDTDIFISYEDTDVKDWESLEEEYFIDEDEAMKYIQKKFDCILKCECI